MNKSIFLALVFTVFACIFANANQKQTVNNGEKFTFLSEQTATTGFSFNHEGITNFAKKSGGGSNKVAAFKGMGIAGVVVLAISAVLVLTGAVMIGVGYYLLGGIYNYSSYASLTTFGGLGTGTYLIWGGSALIGLFSTFFVIGLALAIVGFALSHYYSKKAGLFFENKPELATSSYGLTIKL